MSFSPLPCALGVTALTVKSAASSGKLLLQHHTSLLQESPEVTVNILYNLFIRVTEAKKAPGLKAKGIRMRLH